MIVMEWEVRPFVSIDKHRKTGAWSGAGRLPSPGRPVNVPPLVNVTQLGFRPPPGCGNLEG
jgi:hypothetical protein